MSLRGHSGQIIGSGRRVAAGVTESLGDMDMGKDSLARLR